MTNLEELPEKFIRFLKSVKAKRAKTVIDHILKYGFITTEELKERYGYNHPPRAVRDVRELGIPIITYRIEGADGRKLGAYKFGDPSKARFNKLAGRTALSKKLKDALISRYGCKCFIYLESLPENQLQIDHRIPYEVTGDGDGSVELNPDDFMLLSASANRAKSWSCENCENWKNEKRLEVCSTCYWAYPEKYTHIAMKDERRVDILWQNAEIEQFDQLSQESKKYDISVQRLIKDILSKRKR